jgi:glycine cleavage system H protein
LRNEADGIAVGLSMFTLYPLPSTRPSLPCQAWLSRLPPTTTDRSVSDIPKDLLYTEEHEYVKPTEDDNIVAIGVTDYAQGELGDIVFIELPQIGTNFGKHDVFGTIEAVKAVSELYSPLSGEVVEVNDRLDKEPALVNTAPYTDGWMVKLRLRNPSERDELLGAAEYATRLGE